MPILSGFNTSFVVWYLSKKMSRFIHGKNSTTTMATRTTVVPAKPMSMTPVAMSRDTASMMPNWK